MSVTGRIGAALALVVSTAIVLEPTARGEHRSVGSVTGTVRLVATKSTLAASPYGRRGVGPKHGTAGPETRNVIVYIEGHATASPLPPMHTRIVQRDEQFLPPVTAITAGSTIDFPNDDSFFHNVFSLSKAKNFDLGRYPTGKSRAVTFNKPGVVKVFCDIHSHMAALVMVFDHPWFTIPEEDGTFSLTAVPAGDNTVVAWHERIGERRERVTVGPGGIAMLSFTLPVLESTP